LHGADARERWVPPDRTPAIEVDVESNYKQDLDVKSTRL
jgi:hypothetical protein